MYATFTHTRQWVSHHHLLLGALLTLLALAVILLVRALIPFAPAPAQPAASETDVSLVMVPGVRDQYYTEKNVPLGVAARLRYEDMKQRQWEQRDAALDAVSVALH